MIEYIGKGVEKMAMSNEEFQQIVLQKLETLEVGQKNLVDGQKNLEVGQNNLEKRQKNLEMRQTKLEKRQESLEIGQTKLEKRQKSLEIGQKEIKKDIKAIIEQTANLTEFREEINNKVDTLTNELNTIEFITSKNWNDIAKLKLAK